MKHFNEMMASKSFVFVFYSSSVTLLLLVFAILSLNVNHISTVSSSNTFLIGNKISCNEEGQIVVIPFLRSNPCITCMCLNSEIDCFKDTCPQTINCYYYHSNHSNGGSTSCCQKCVSCSIGNWILKNGELIQDKNDVCKSYYCNSGTLTTYKTECHVPCDKPIRFLGQCCPSCNACPKGAKDGEEVVTSHHANSHHANSHDECIRCYCFKGQMICHRKVCPVLPCPQSEWIKQKNSCCAICKGNKVIDTDLDKGSCVIGDKVYKHLDKFLYDECTTCVCQNSTNICQRQSCPKLSCSESEQFKPEGQCCPRCGQIPRVKKGMNLDCMHQNHHFKNGEWIDSCKQCKCIQGKVECSNRICPHDFVCPYGHRKVRRNGECCESCIPEDGRCTLMDSMSNITTYDGRNYHWNGRCNYVLTRDCDAKRFSVHLLNKFHNSSTHSQPIYRGTSLLVRIENTKILLSHLGRTRVNRSLVQLPYIQMGRFSIIQTHERVKLHAIIGVDILWQRNRSIEVKLKSHFRDQTCGLCGNFNLDPDDEFKAKSLKQLVPLEKFVNSFKVGQNVVCPKIKSLLKNKESTKICSQSNFRKRSLNFAIRICNQMKQHLLCENKRNVYEQCLEDMCICRGDKQCQCYAIQRFINDCKGINISNNNTLLQTFMCKSFKCPPGSEFIFCSYECRKTCQNRHDKSTKKLPKLPCRRKECKSGCECIGNRVWFKGQCIPEVMCPYL